MAISYHYITSTEFCAVINGTPNCTANGTAEDEVCIFFKKILDNSTDGCKGICVKREEAFLAYDLMTRNANA